MSIDATIEDVLSGKDFSCWTKWDDIGNIEGIKKVGIYLLAKIDNKPSSNIDPSINRIIYIGETVSQTIKKRLQQFGNSAFKREIGHSGGWTFNDLFLSNKIGSIPEWLHVSVLPVDLDETNKGAYIRFVERLIIYQFVLKNKAMPVCNSK